MQNLTVTLATTDRFEVRSFDVSETLSALFEVRIIARCANPDVDFEEVVGRPAQLELFAALPAPGVRRVWSGVCTQIWLVRAEATGLSTYEIAIMPAMWLLTQRRNHRIFQQESEPEIVLALLREWGIEPVLRLAERYKARKYRVQYGESDFAFASRMLEDVGISYYFREEGDETRLCLSDAPQANEPRRAKIPFLDQPTVAAREYVTKVRVGRRVRPGRYTMQDHDYRRTPQNQPRATFSGASSVEGKLERFHYTPGAFLFRSETGDPTPAADDRGMVRTDDGEAARLAQLRLEAKRSSAKICTFETNAHDLGPGAVVSLLDHPRSDLAVAQLVVSSRLSGTHDGEWTHACEVRSAEAPFRPPLSTEKPRVVGVESATVVGPSGEEIHTDEFGRVRVHFHWDRESRMDEQSGCWLHVNQPWGGAGYGATNLPRIGQEVLVEFLGGDPDRPVVIGRVYTNLQRTPYALPAHKTQSGWRSNSSPATGGYNEMMFEDDAGEELLRMQAEKNLHKLVKNDEEVKIGRDRSKEVGNDDRLEVGRDRSRQVGHDETVKVGNDETRQVGGNRSRQVGGNEELQVGGDRNKSVGGGQSSTVAKSLLEQIGQSARQLVGHGKSEVVGTNRSAMVGGVNAVTAGERYLVGVSPAGEDAGAAGTYVKLEGNRIITKTLEGGLIQIDGTKIIIHADDVSFQASKEIQVVKSGPMTIRGGDEVKVSGAKVMINALNGLLSDMPDPGPSNYEKRAMEQAKKKGQDVAEARAKAREELKAKARQPYHGSQETNEQLANRLGAQHDVPPALIMGFGYQESEFGQSIVKSAGMGADKTGYGYFQVDPASGHTPTRSDGPWGEAHFQQAMGVLKSCIDTIGAVHSDWNQAQRLIGGVRAYNRWIGGIDGPPKDAASWAALDKKTANGRYSRNVVAMAKIFAEMSPIRATRVGPDLSKPHDACGSVPAAQGSSDVLIAGMKAVRQGDAFQAHGCPAHPPHEDVVVKGSQTVKINSRDAARADDLLDHGNVIKDGSSTVLIGG